MKLFGNIHYLKYQIIFLISIPTNIDIVDVWGMMQVFEIWYDTKEHKWGYPEFENSDFSFRISNQENSPYYLCYMRDVKVFVLNNSKFPQLLK